MAALNKHLTNDPTIPARQIWEALGLLPQLRRWKVRWRGPCPPHYDPQAWPTVAGVCDRWVKTIFLNPVFAPEAIDTLLHETVHVIHSDSHTKRFRQIEATLRHQLGLRAIPWCHTKRQYYTYISPMFAPARRLHRRRYAHR